MPYKQKSPFGNFRNPNRTKNNYNPAEFKMPDLSPIYNKTADGSTVTEEADKEGANQGMVNENVLNDIDKSKGNPSTPNAIKNEAQKRKLEVKAEEKAFKQKLKDARQAKNLRAKYQTAEEKKQATEAFNTIKDENKFRRQAKLNRENKEDARNRIMMEQQAAKVKKLDSKDLPGDFSFAQEISEQENKPMERIRVSGNSASWTDYQAPFNDPSVLRTDEPPMDATEKRKMQMIKDPLGRGFNMVSRKGSAFPMVSDSPLNFNTNARNPKASTGTGTSTGTSTSTGAGASTNTGTSTNTGVVNTAGSSTGAGNNTAASTGVGNSTAASTGAGNNTAVGTGTNTNTGAGTGASSGAGSGTNAGVKVGGGTTGGTGVGGVGGSTGVLIANTNTGTGNNTAIGIKSDAEGAYSGKANNFEGAGNVNPFDASNLAATPNGDRASKGENTGKLTNNVLPGLSAGSVPARGIQRDMQFNNKAMSSGELYAPPQPTGMNANTDSSFNTQQTKTFDDDGAMGMYATSRSSFPKIDFKSLKKGALRKELNVPEGEKIPLSKLEIKPGDSETTKKRKNLAKTMRKF